MDIINVVEWSRAQFALTACYHWLFVPLKLGLGIIVAVMETVYYRTRKQEWLSLTKFWMTLFGVNFAIGVATGIILEFEFGTNFSNYSWFVGDIFGAPLAIEGILLTMFDSRTNLSQQVVREVKKHFPRQVFPVVIPRNVRLSEAPSHGVPVMYYDRSSNGAKCYEKLAECIIQN